MGKAEQYLEEEFEADPIDAVLLVEVLAHHHSRTPLEFMTTDMWAELEQATQGNPDRSRNHLLTYFSLLEQQTQATHNQSGE